jgi:hypothetical protein
MTTVALGRGERVTCSIVLGWAPTNPCPSTPLAPGLCGGGRKREGGEKERRGESSIQPVLSSVLGGEGWGGEGRPGMFVRVCER